MRGAVRKHAGWMAAVAIVLGLAPFLQKCGGTDIPPGVYGSITVSNQVVTSSTQSVAMDVILVADGFLVITADSGNSPDPANQLGETALLASGTHNDQSVNLTTPVTNGQKLWAVILEDDGDGTLEYPGDDTVKVRRTFTVYFQSVTADNQSPVLTTLVTVAEVRSVDGGWLVIHDASAGGASNILGHVELDPGIVMNVSVELDAPTASATLYAVIHDDAGVNGTWEPGTDNPVMDPGVIEDSMTVTIAAGTPDVRINVVNSGASAYSWTSVVPSTAEAGLFPGGLGSNKAVTFTQDTRYEIVNGGGSAHPFQLVTCATCNGSDDTVVLSQSSAGSLEGNGGINWVEVSATTMRFTATTTLQSSLNGYRCGVHTTVMRGDASIP